ncbi:CidA/LrgA family protein [Chitinilyticum piscinae]|uniref:CidA/LrgA family protein n=1 Tax=Chitinilyticum piscinae TaxID=2866724 RepID=A0A8J7K9S6_9NEIS|nr:CidA/LrgA family protein [Chitinilyticum piscinae]MBE9608599.1 CidA/LrgA family protein [Chitinilyticum piscinae]
MLYGFTFLVIFQLLGEVLSRGLHLPVPGPVLGMLLLVAWAVIKRGVDDRVGRVCSGLLRYMALLFVPAGVGLMLLGPLLRDEGWAMLAVLVLSTIITLLVAGLTLHRLLRRRHPSADEFS